MVQEVEAQEDGTNEDNNDNGNNWRQLNFRFTLTIDAG